MLTPFIDDIFLSIRQPKKNVFRCLLVLLLCPDLMDIKCIGTKKMFDLYNGKPYDFYEAYAEYIPEAKEILAYWGKEKCDNILKED